MITRLLDAIERANRWPTLRPMRLEHNWRIRAGRALHSAAMEDSQCSIWATC